MQAGANGEGRQQKLLRATHACLPVVYIAVLMSVLMGLGAMHRMPESLCIIKPDTL